MERQRYPLIPHLRYCGDKYLLLWHTHNTQHQVFLANSIEQAMELWFIAQKEEGLEASAKELWKATIVLPPDWLVVKYNEQCHREDLNNFIWHTCFEIDEYRKRHNKLPPNVVRCQNKPDHAGCCLGGEYIPKASWEVLFEANWEGAQPWTGKKRNLTPFDGILADPDAPLYVCELNGGHHSGGIQFRDVKENSKLMRDGVLFFFHGQKLEMPKEIVDSISRLKEEEKHRRERSKISAKERWERSRREQDERLIRMLSHQEENE